MHCLSQGPPGSDDETGSIASMSTLASEASSTADSANRAKRLLMKRKMEAAEKKVQ